MRILNLKFANINSLQGSWEIDFQNNAFQSAGIFAITGKTGSGKTTILDAICLALYDKTPRVSNPTAGEITANEVMNWDSTECFAELTFEVKGKQYKAYWKQKKTRKRNKDSATPEKLAKPVVGLDERIDGSWSNIADNKTKKEQKIEETLGLGFDQFTRSVLLAQGSFSAFLKSDKNLRADTLEKITGTEIYSTISKKVYLKAQSVKTEYDQQKIKIDSLQMLSAEERQEIRKRQTSLNDALSQSKKELDDLNAQKQWLENIQKITSELNAKETDLKRLLNQTDVFAQKRNKVERAKKAAKIEPLFTNLQSDLATSSSIRKLLSDNRKHLESVDKQIDEKAKELDTAQTNLVIIEQSNSELIKLINVVLPIDNSISEKQKTLTDKNTKLLSTQKEKIAKESELKRENKGLLKLKNELALLQSEVDSLSKWKITDDKLLDLKELIAVNRAKVSSLGDQQDKVKELQKQLKELKKSFAQIDEKQSELKQELKKLLDQLRADQQELEVNLNGKDLPTFYEDCQKARTELTNCKELCDKAKDFASEKETIRLKEKELVDVDEKLKKDQALIESKKNELETANENLEDVKELIKIHDLVAERDELEEGKPCPLCGATTHPFADHLPDGLKESQSKKRNLESKIKKLGEEIDGLGRAEAEMKGSIKTFKRNLITEKEKFDNRIAKFVNNNQSVLGQVSDKSLDQIIQFLETKCSQLYESGEQTNKNEKEVKSLVSKIEKSQKKIDKVNEKLEANKDAYSEAKSQIDLSSGKLEASEKELEKILNEIDHHDNKARSNYFEYLGPDVDNKTLWPELEILLKRAQELGKKTKALEEKQQQEKLLSQKIEGLALNLDAKIQELSEKSQEVESIRKDLDAAKAQRFTLFGDKNPATEEKLSSQKLSKVKESLSKTKEEADSLDKEKVQINTKIEEENKQLKELQKSLGNKEANWKQALVEAGFKDDSDWKQANVEEALVIKTQQEIDDYDKNLHSLKNIIDNTSKALTEEKAKALTDKPIEEVTNLVFQKTTLNEKTLTELGELKEKLKNDDEKLAERTILEQELSAIEKVMAVWDRLNDLVGSAGGNKYKVFVQSLLLKTLVQKANQELSKITDRYILVAGDENLELKLIDRDLAGQERTSNNLSGGETFIVSLALALGLSKMASQNVKIDSLFLDEGFGSLDQESLERALSALGHLNAQGKIVGVISHVPLIQERVPVKIEVIADGSGRSRLEGPGVSKHANT